MSPLRIAAHISAAEWGGAERRSIALLAALAHRGHDIVVYCNTSHIAEHAAGHGLRAVISPLRGDAMLNYVLRFASHLRRQKPDVLLLITFRRLLTGALAGRLARVPRIISRVGLATDVARRAKYRFALDRWIDDVVLNAHSLRAPFVASLPPRADVRVHVVPNGIAVRDSDATREQARATFGVPADAFAVGCVARLVKQKRLDRLIEAVASLDTVHAVIAGDGYMRRPLEQLATALGCDGRVHFAGHVEDVARVHRALDAYVVASDQEGMSSGMLEAMAAGLPVVSTPVSGTAEALDTPACGIITEFDPAAIAAAIRSLEQDPALRERLGRAAARVARERYALHVMVDRWEALLTGRSAAPEPARGR